MLESIRKFAQTKVIKIFLGVIVLAFALSGLSGLGSMSFSDKYKVKVGNEKIYDETVESKYRQVVQNIRMSGKDFSEEQLASFGFSRDSVLRNLVTESLIRQHSKEMGISVGDDVVANFINNNEGFKTDSKFDKNKFSRTLLAMGYPSEKAFVNDVKADIENKILIGTVQLSAPLNKFAVRKLAEGRKQTRDVEIVKIPAGFKRVSNKPTDKQLDEYYLENAFRFEIPESRDVSFFTIKKTKDNESEIYDLSNKIEDELAGGATLDEVAKKFSLKLEKLKDLTKEDERKSKLFVETAFGVAAGEASGLVEDKAGEYFVVHADKISDSRIPELKEVKDDVIASWMEDQETIQNEQFAADIIKEIKPETNLQTLAAKYKLQYQTKKAVKLQDAVSQGDRGLYDIFTAREGEVKGAFTDKDGGFRIFRLAKINVPQVADSDLNQYNAETEQLVAQEVMDQYFGYLKEKYPVSVNPNLKKQKIDSFVETPEKPNTK